MLVYRPDIDGLRALAVVGVILFHTKLLGVSGGYVGVDVFFVISGFLITSILFKSLETDNFSITDFYDRRVRRIFPALFFLLLVTTVVSSFLLMPQEFESFGRSLVSSSLFSSNILFWREAGYFDMSGDMKPLLHTWSVSLEEQFYILFPLYLWFLYRFLRPYLLIITLLCLCFSFSLSLWTLSLGKDMATFYLLPTRAWELLVGSMLALGRFPPISNQRLIGVMSVSGLLFILLPMFMYTHKTTFPGMNALWPVIGTALLIYSGTTSLEGRVQRILSLRPVAFIGKISYSLYLWHWPILVFASYYLIRDLYIHEKIVVLIVCFVVSVLSWNYIETPFRKKINYSSRKQVLFFGALLIVLGSAYGTKIIINQGDPQRFPTEVSQLALAKKGPQTPSYNLPNLKNRNYVLGDGLQDIERQPSFLVLGDSHANAVSPALSMVGQHLGIKGLLLKHAGCMPAFNITEKDLSKDCAVFNKTAYNIIQDSNFQSVILIARWSAYPRWMSVSKKDSDKEVAFLKFEALLDETIEDLQSRDIKVSLVMEVPPIEEFAVPSVLSRNLYFYKKIKDLRPLKEAYLNKQKRIHQIMKNLQNKHHVNLVYPHSSICGDEYCHVVHDGRSLYYDSDHLSTYGAQHISPLFYDLLDEQARN